MSVLIGYIFTPITNTAGNVSAVLIQHSTNGIVYDANYKFHGTVGFTWNTTTNAYYFSCGDQRLSMQYAEIAWINGSTPPVDPFAAAVAINAVMPNS